MALAIRAPFSALPLGGDFIALLETALSYFSRERLTSEQREQFAHIEALSERFGAYVLEARERDDLLVRVDILLEDPDYHRALLGASAESLPLSDALVEDATTLTARADTFLSACTEVLGPAASPHLREAHRCMLAFTESARLVASLLPEEALASSEREFIAATTVEGGDPLEFLSDPRVPVPVARALLAGMRCTVFTMAACAALFRHERVEGWLGLALAEQWAEQTRGFVALFASLFGTEASCELVPPHLRFDPKRLDEQARAVCEAYARFNADAERSGEPVYPSSS